MILWTVVLEKPLESPLDSKEVQPVHPKGNQSWIFIGRTDVEAETPILWPPDAKNWLIWKDPDAGKYWRWEEKGTTEDEMVGWLTDAMDISLSKPWICWWTGSAAVHGVAKSWTWLSDWTELSPVIWNRKSSPVFSTSSRLAMRKKRRLVTTFLRWVTVSSLQSESSRLFSAPSVKTANVSLPLRAWELWLKLSCLGFNFISD